MPAARSHGVMSFGPLMAVGALCGTQVDPACDIKQLPMGSEMEDGDIVTSFR